MSGLVAIVPAAGLGTRFLPTTKTVAKELLPVLDTPAIDLVAAEAAAAGVERMVIVTSASKDDLVGHLRLVEGLEAIKLDSVVQPQPLGLGDAVACAEPLLSDGDDPVLVLLPDALLLPVGVLVTMSRVRAAYGGSVLCAVQADPRTISAYGVLAVAPAPEGSDPNVLRVKGMVEKPRPEDAPSRFAAAGRYLLDRKVFDTLRRTAVGVGGEVQLTDAIARLIDEGHPVHAVVHHARHHDLGNPVGYLEASIDLALDREEYGPQLRQWLVNRTKMALGWIQRGADHEEPGTASSPPQRDPTVDRRD